MSPRRLIKIMAFFIICISSLCNELVFLPFMDSSCLRHQLDILSPGDYRRESDSNLKQLHYYIIANYSWCLLQNFVGEKLDRVKR